MNISTQPQCTVWVQRQKLNISDSRVTGSKVAGNALTRLWVAVGGVIVTLTRSTAGAAEVKETWVAVVTLLSIHSRLAHTRP